MIELSCDCELSEIKNLWAIIMSHKLNSITNFKEFYKRLSVVIRLIEDKFKTDNKLLTSHFYELAKNVNLGFKLHFMSEMSDSNINDINILLQFPQFFSENTYHIIQSISSNFKSFPQIFFNSVDDYVKKIDISREIFSEWSYNIQNLFINVKNYITYEQNKNNSAKFLFDSNIFSIKNMEIKLEGVSKVNFFNIRLLE